MRGDYRPKLGRGVSAIFGKTHGDPRHACDDRHIGGLDGSNASGDLHRGGQDRIGPHARSERANGEGDSERWHATNLARVPDTAFSREERRSPCRTVGKVTEMQAGRPRRKEHDLLLTDTLVRAGFWLLYGRQNGVADDGETSAAETSPSATAAESATDADAELVGEVTAYLAWIGVGVDYASTTLRIIAVAQALAISTPTATITAARYEQLRADVLAETGQASRKGVALWPVTSQTIMKRLGGGSWAGALAELGVGISGRGRARVRLRFAESDYVDAVVAFLQHARSAVQTPSYSAYTAWVSRQKEDGIEYPSGSAVRAYFGSWGAAVSRFSPHPPTH